MQMTFREITESLRNCFMLYWWGKTMPFSTLERIKRIAISNNLLSPHLAELSCMCLLCIFHCSAHTACRTNQHRRKHFHKIGYHMDHYMLEVKEDSYCKTAENQINSIQLSISCMVGLLWNLMKSYAEWNHMSVLVSWILVIVPIDHRYLLPSYRWHQEMVGIIRNPRDITWDISETNRRWTCSPISVIIGKRQQLELIRHHTEFDRTHSFYQVCCDYVQMTELYGGLYQSFGQNDICWYFCTGLPDRPDVGVRNWGDEGKTHMTVTISPAAGTNSDLQAYHVTLGNETQIVDAQGTSLVIQHKPN